MGVEIPEGFGIFSVKMACQGDPEPMVTTCGYSPTGLSPAETALLVWDAGVDASLLSPTANSSSWTQLGVAVTFNDGGNMVLAENPRNSQGSGIGAVTVPPNCAILVKKVTDTGGRKHRGRFFWPPSFLDAGDVTPAGYLESAAVTNHGEKFDQFLAALILGGVQPVVLHSSLLDAPTEITSFQMQTQLATQRKRLR